MHFARSSHRVSFTNSLSQLLVKGLLMTERFFLTMFLMKLIASNIWLSITKVATIIITDITFTRNIILELQVINNCVPMVIAIPLNKLSNIWKHCAKQPTSYIEKSTCEIELKHFNVSLVKIFVCFYIKSPRRSWDLLVSI